MRLFAFISFLWVCNLGFSQDVTDANPLPREDYEIHQVNFLDSILSEKEYLHLVAKYHPIAQQAQLMEEQGEMIVRSNRGGFDPKAFYDFNDKNFKDKNYYDLAHLGLKVPTWYGLEFKTGWEYTYGQFTNPMDNTPSEGLGYVGASLTLGQGLFIDKRRAQLLKAKQYKQMTINDRNNLINDLFRDAIFQYWEWAAAYEKVNLLKSTLKNSETRYVGIKRLAQFGELSSLDTLEAFTQIQAVQTEVFEAEAKYLQETFELNVYLWNNNLEPQDIPDYQKPEALMQKINSGDFQMSVVNTENLIDNHPILMTYQNKLETLLVDKRLKAEKLKPKINLQYNFLTGGYQYRPGEYATNNYKWGVNMSMPIFLRKERGDLALAKIKIEQQQFKNRMKEQEIIAKIQTYKAKMEALIKQGEVYEQAVNGYTTLLRQEEIKLEQGASSLFKLTLREIKMFRASLKLVDLHLKLVQAATMYNHSGGQLYNLDTNL